MSTRKISCTRDKTSRNFPIRVIMKAFLNAKIITILLKFRTPWQGIDNPLIIGSKNNLNNNKITRLAAYRLPDDLYNRISGLLLKFVHCYVCAWYNVSSAGFDKLCLLHTTLTKTVFTHYYSFLFISDYQTY